MVNAFLPMANLCHTKLTQLVSGYLAVVEEMDESPLSKLMCGKERKY